MATKSIGATGRDYATFALHASYLDGLDTLSAAEVGEAYNDAEFSVAGTIATYTGFVASSTNTVTIQPASGQGFKSHASAASNPLKYNQSNGVGLKCTGVYSHAVVISVDHVKLKGLQILHTNANNRFCLQHITSGLTGVLVDACILEKAASTSGIVAEFRAGTMQNCLLIQRQSAGGNGLELSYPGTDVTLFNNTIVRPSDITAGDSGILAANGTTSVKNCAIFGFTTFVNDNTRFSGSNNASNVTIGFGTSNQASLTYSSQFEDVVDSGGVDFRAKSGGALIDNGTNTGAPSTDIIGQAISNTTRDIGCWELQGAAGLTLLKIINETDQSSEALQRLRAMLRQTAETDQNAEAKQSPRVQVRPVSESVSVSEALQAVRAVIRLVAETESISSLELITRAIILLRDETVQIAETAINVRGLAQVIAETQQASEAAARLLTLLRQTAESESVSEAKQTIRALARVLAEAVSVSETSIAARVMARILAETGATAENVQITKAFAKVVAESMAPSEGSVIALGRVREIAEALQIAEALVILLAKVMQRDETSQVSETKITLRTIIRLIAETEADSEALIRLATYVRQADESSATAETTIAARVMLRLIAETEQVSETSIRSFVITAAIGALLMTARCLTWLGMTGAADPTLTTETKVKPTTE